MPIDWSPARVMAIVEGAFPPALAAASGVARMKAPSETGELARSISFQMRGSMVGALVATAPHAAAQNFGASAHEIVPVNKLALAGDGFGPVARVNHPGNPGTHFMEAGAASAIAFIKARISATV